MDEIVNSRATQKKILFVATVSYPFNTQLNQLILFLQEEGWDTHVLCSDKPNIQGISFHPLNIAREISPIRDITSLFRLFLFLKRNDFSIVHSFNPKSGLLCSIAAKLAGNPIRLHTFTGQVWATLTGLKKMLVKYSDKVIGILSSKCYCDSFSQKEFLVKEKVIFPEKLTVLAKGSLSGVDLKRFNRARFQEEELAEFRKQLNLSSKDFVLLFVGRITRDKGIKELIDAYQVLKVQYSNMKLLVVGPEEA
jgi:glycosyltransferase involved in cell wall biosynthesis